MLFLVGDTHMMVDGHKQSKTIFYDILIPTFSHAISVMDTEIQFAHLGMLI